MQRLGFLDALRGVAAIYVAIFHLALVSTPLPDVPQWLRSFVYFGGPGVTLFLVVSAFSLSLTIGRHVRTGHGLLSYGVSRFFRIAPLFYLLVLATFWSSPRGFTLFGGSVSDMAGTRSL